MCVYIVLFESNVLLIISIIYFIKNTYVDGFRLNRHVETNRAVYNIEYKNP